MIAGWLGQNSTSGAGVLTVSGWMVDNTDPTNPVILPATWEDVLNNGNSANQIDLDDVFNINSTPATDMAINADKDFYLTTVGTTTFQSGTYFITDLATNIVLDGAGNFNIDTIIFEISDPSTNLFFQVDTTADMVSQGNLTGAGNGLTMVTWDGDDQWFVYDGTGGFFFLGPASGAVATAFKGCRVDLTTNIYEFGNTNTNKSFLNINDTTAKTILTAARTVMTIDNNTISLDVSKAGGNAFFSCDGLLGLSQTENINTLLGVKAFTFTGGILTSVV